MPNSAVSIDSLWKYFRLYHEKNQYLKATLLKGRRSRFEEFWALKDVSFEIPEGSTFGIIGSNGSGKSTLLKLLAGILTPDKGSVQVNGRISALLELGAGFHPDLTGRENVFLNGAILGMTNKEIEKNFDDIVEFAGLGQFIDTPVKNYSSGMVVRLGFAIATNVDPEILIIDEVLAVGDASFQQRCFEKIESFRKEGRTIILVSHGLSQITQLCSTALWLEKSEVRMIGPAYEVVSEYTGESHNAVEKVQGDIGDRWGSGEVQIEAVVFLDGHGNATSKLETGKAASIRIDYFAHTPVENIVCGIRITHLHGMNIWGTNTKRRGIVIPRAHGRASITLEIKNMTLMEGTYDLTVSISDLAEAHAYDHWEKKLRYDVRQVTRFVEGISLLDAEWVRY
jgi:ABC-2 type transport system ATP-binding protein